jgi:hypothetical protein
MTIVNVAQVLGIVLLGALTATGLGLVARHYRPYRTTADLKATRFLCLVAMIVGIVTMVPYTNLWLRSSQPVVAVVADLVLGLLGPVFLFVRASGLPYRRLWPSR